MSHHNPSTHLGYNLKREISELYVSVAIKNFAAGMVVIFTPIYLYIKFDGSLSKVLIYFSALSFLISIFSPLGMKIMKKVGVKHAILLSIPLLIAFFIVLINLDYHFLFIPLSLLLYVVYNISFWPALHADFVRFSSSKKRGVQVSFMRIIGTASVVVAPFVGGLIIVKFGFAALFTVASILLLLSVVPLFLSKEVHEINSFSYKNLFKYTFKETDKKVRLALASLGAERSINAIFWPIFIFTIGINVKSLGALTSGAIMFGLLTSIFVGRLTDKGKQKKLLKLGVIFTALAYILKIFVKTDLQAFWTHSFYRTSNEMLSVPFFALFYNWISKDRDTMDKNIIFREVMHNLGRGGVLALFSLLALFVSNVALFFIAAAIAILLVAQINRLVP